MKVTALKTGGTPDIGDFKEGIDYNLPDDLAREAIRQGLFERKEKPTKKKSEVKDDGGE